MGHACSDAVAHRGLIVGQIFLYDWARDARHSLVGYTSIKSRRAVEASELLRSIYCKGYVAEKTNLERLWLLAALDERMVSLKSSHQEKTRPPE